VRSSGPRPADGGRTDGDGRSLRGSWLPYFYIAAAVVPAYLLFGVVWDIGAEALRVVMLAGTALCGLYALVCRRSPERVMAALFAAGVVMRIGYMLYTPYNVRAHDVAALVDSGHLTYVYNLFAFARLPQTYNYEFYQPPLQHIAEAAAVKLFSLFRPEERPEILLDAAKIVPCFASCAMMVISRRICEAAGLSRRAALIALAVVAFQPTFYLLSSSINNDMLMLLFFMASVLYTIRWYKRPTMKNILLTALCIGLSMMAKLSGATAAFFTGPVFLIVLIKSVREGNAKRIVAQFAAFVAVCVPLALWYPVRNYLLFHQPLSYVFQPDVNTPMYCGNRTMIERFLSFPLRQMLDPTYCRPAGDFNLWLYTLKCSVFGEYAFDQPAFLAHGLILANLLLILISLAATVYVLARGRETDALARFGLFGIWAVQIVSFIIFNLKFPFGCTMDFRYIVPTAIVGAIYLGIALDRLGHRGTMPPRLLYGFGCAAVGAFAVLSVLFYTV
jgi:hypothetical protein